MRSFEKTKRKIIAPRADILIESMRDIGYSLQTAIADIIDNSITAESCKIELLVNTHSDNPAIGILDDGTGIVGRGTSRCNAAWFEESPRTVAPGMISDGSAWGSRRHPFHSAGILRS